ncbi:Crp/Fnr family transcriptional regulator [Chryseobacterium arachidis]|uniref:Crp/Fnr family transcriptional regulator n=1 Tax=Chryseobacterium arachidis TaxID=1416778 RepID=UPI00361AFA28
MNNQLSRHILKLIPTFENEIDKISGYFEAQSFPKNHILIDQGDSVDFFYFVLKGCLHMYYTDQNGEDHTIHFAIEDWWVTEYNAFLGNPTASFSIAALEDVEVLVIKKYKFEEMLLSFPLMALYFNKIHMRAYGAALQKQKPSPSQAKKISTVISPTFIRY